jgi:siroheme synthase (precorrin-2 oxidase/ferrochelatase)
MLLLMKKIMKLRNVGFVFVLGIMMWLKRKNVVVFGGDKVVVGRWMIKDLCNCGVVVVVVVGEKREEDKRMKKMN